MTKKIVVLILFTLFFKSSFSQTKIQMKRDGTYMWLDGTIIGMSFKPMKDRCIVYGSDGGYFCTLYRK